MHAAVSSDAVRMSRLTCAISLNKRPTQTETLAIESLVIHTLRRKFVSLVKVNVDKYFNINGVIQLVRSLVSGTSPGERLVIYFLYAGPNLP